VCLARDVGEVMYESETVIVMCESSALLSKATREQSRCVDAVRLSYDVGPRGEKRLGLLVSQSATADQLHFLISRLHSTTCCGILISNGKIGFTY
jgi:hypothetical protein